MSSKSPRFGRLIAIFKKIDDHIAVNRLLFCRNLYESRSFRKKLTKNRPFLRDFDDMDSVISYGVKSSILSKSCHFESLYSHPQNNH
jgi:hypothetical protein